jgi:hypothetical protein
VKVDKSLTEETRWYRQYLFQQTQFGREVATKTPRTVSGVQGSIRDRGGSRRTPLPRKARFITDEAMVEFTRRAGGPRTLEDRNILAMMIQNKSGEITLELTDEQYDKLRRADAKDQTVQAHRVR